MVNNANSAPSCRQFDEADTNERGAVGGSTIRTVALVIGCIPECWASKTASRDLDGGHLLGTPHYGHPRTGLYICSPATSFFGQDRGFVVNMHHPRSGGKYTSTQDHCQIGHSELFLDRGEGGQLWLACVVCHLPLIPMDYAQPRSASLGW